MSSATDHFNADFSTTCKKIPRYSGELARQMADRFVALHYFHGVFVHGVVKLSLSNKFFSDRCKYINAVLISPAFVYLCPSLVSRLLPLNDCVVTKQTFCIVLQRFIFVHIPSFSFQLWALAMKRTVVSRRE